MNSPRCHSKPLLKKKRSKKTKKVSPKRQNAAGHENAQSTFNDRGKTAALSYQREGKRKATEGMVVHNQYRKQNSNNGGDK